MIIVQSGMDGIHFTSFNQKILVQAFDFLDMFESFGFSFVLYIEGAPACGDHYIVQRIRVF